jgi:hydroxyacylglutathione hydrolase
MLLKRFYDTQLAQASYLVGCQATGDAIIIDPNRDTAQYQAAVKAEGMRLAYVTETHIHADFLSGTRELAAASGARPVLSDEGGEDWRYGWAREAGAQLVKDGAVLMVGNVRVEVLHTPGHTPEHICFRITDTKATDRPMGVFTGDFIFVGDVGRPDLLEKAAGVKGTMDAAARQLYASLQRFKSQPDYLQLWPGHGAGSACGKSLGAVPSSTMGYERIANWAFNAASENEFVTEVLTGQPEPPAYFAVMKRLNRDGPPPKPTARPGRVAAASLAGRMAEGAVVADTRKTVEFAAHHVRGSLNVPLGGSFATYAGQILPHGRPLLLVVPETALDQALAGLASIGLDQVAGWLPPDELGPAAADTTAQVKPAEAAQRVEAGEAVILDVRARSEWDEGHIPGAVHVPLSTIQQHIADVPEGMPIILHCGGGGRSAVAASVLRSHGIHEVMNLTGGIDRWKKEGLPTEKNGDGG